MGNVSDLPLRLYKANLELQMRIGRLIQQSGSDWIDLGTQALGEGVAEGEAEASELLRSHDWQGLAAMPVEAFWRQAQQRIGDSQALVQVAVNAQNAFASGLIEAVQDWQRETADALAGAGKTTDLDEAWHAAFEPWRQFLSSFAPPGKPPAAGRGPRKRGG
jgi:hypothetical protein